ncbi:MAG: sensor histidine kinase [Lachnospiraceae bacterium]
MKLKSKLIISYAIITVFLSVALVIAYGFCDKICKWIPSMSHRGMTVFTILSLIVFIITLGMSILFATRISKPLALVNTKTKEIAEGKYGEQITHYTNIVEADALIDSINELASKLKKQQIIKKQMARDYAHEFRTPLTVIQSNLEGIIDGVFEPTTERIESIRQEILRLSRMVNQIDKIVEIEKQDVTIWEEVFDLSEMLRSNVIAFEREAKTKNIQLILQTVPCPIMGDRDKLSQVIMNMMSNALKYTDGGQIIITSKSYEDGVSFSVADTGIGISEQDLPYIFEPLYRADKSRTRNTGGTGIGLAITKSIIEAWGGKIEVVSEVSKGSKFIVTLRT